MCIVGSTAITVAIVASTVRSSSTLNIKVENLKIPLFTVKVAWGSIMFINRDIKGRCVYMSLIRLELIKYPQAVCDRVV